jgi:hypothetical protein
VAIKSDIVNPIPHSESAANRAPQEFRWRRSYAKLCRHPGERPYADGFAHDQPEDNANADWMAHSCREVPEDLNTGISEGKKGHDQETHPGVQKVLDPVQRRFHHFQFLVHRMKCRMALGRACGSRCKAVQ